MNKLLTLLCLAATTMAWAEQPTISPKGYTVETVKTPLDEQGKPLFFDVGGIDFAEDGTAYIASRLHGIWTYRKGKWHCFAEGLHDPQGIQLLDPKGRSMIVAHKPELTLIEDTDGDGTADSYTCLSNSWRYAGNYCEYVHGPVIDSKGNAYVSLNLSHIDSKMARQLPSLKSGLYMGTTLGYDGWAACISPDGTFTPYASGLRSAAGIGISQSDEILITDNQGEWVPTSCLYHIEKGKFYSHPSSLLDKEVYRTGEKKHLIYDREHLKTIRTLPAIWMPHGELMTSPSNPVFDLSDGKFGPFKGQIFIGCQTLSSVVRATLQKVDGAYQGAVFGFIDHLQSGCIRLDFAPDGSLWVGQTGRGWKSRGAKEYGLQKIKWDSKNAPFEIKDIKLTKTGFKVEFTEPADLDNFSADDVSISHWTYNYWEKYGSPKVDVKTLKSVITEKASDGLSIHFDTSLVKERVYAISLAIKSRTGKAPTTNKGYYTLNRLLPHK